MNPTPRCRLCLPGSDQRPLLSPLYVSPCSLECPNHQHLYYTQTKRANDDVQKTASTQTDREQPPETTEGVSDSGQGHAGASAGQVGGVGETLTEAEVERLARRHANLSWTICYSRGCLFHKGAKEAARYWPEDHARPERRVKKLTRQAKKGQEHQRSLRD